MQPRRHREVLARVALVCFGIVVAVLALEAALQAGSLVIRATGRSPREVAHAGHRTLLCLGDSNVYGLHVEHQEAWPSVLEALWNADERRAPVDVVNLGFPGTNSSTLRNALPKLLSIFHPTLVLVMVGVNDFWTVPQPVEDADLSTRVDGLLWRTLRVYRLVYMIRRAFEAPEIDLTWRGEDRPNTAVVRYGRERVQWSHTAKEGGYPQWRAALRTNLAEIAAQIRRTGAQPVFVTYPADLPFSSIYGVTNATLRDAAAATETSLIDLGPAMAPRCRPPDCDEFFPDEHPTVTGHRRAAEIVFHELLQTDGQR